MEEQPLVLLRSSDYIAMNPHAREKFWRYNFTTQAGIMLPSWMELLAGLEWSGAGCLAKNTGLGSRGPELAHVEGTTYSIFNLLSCLNLWAHSVRTKSAQPPDKVRVCKVPNSSGNFISLCDFTKGLVNLTLHDHGRSRSQLKHVASTITGGEVCTYLMSYALDLLFPQSASIDPIPVSNRM
ncbi:hypothetical protein TIFTF001_033480 [Ficus carica]|uniref:Uncharacterized protein n=1 Tax=Ficus carica TaxID=3494 RepID=A0AA88DZ94_FICCA|nr:hypothetical protein TIFTF001_033480 [Ficus carica]